MIFKLLIGIAAIIGFIWLAKIRNDKFSFIATLILSTSILFIFIPLSITRQIGGIGINIGVLSVIIYGVVKNNLNREQKAVTLLISIPVFISQLGFIFGWENTQWAGLLMLIPLFSYSYILVWGIRSFWTQFGFLTMIASYAIARLALMVQHAI